MIDWTVASRYRRAGLGLGGVLLKQSLYPRELLLRVFDGSAQILDLGCGEGMLANLLAQGLPRTRILGIDRDSTKVRMADSCRSGERARFVEGDFLKADLPGADAVLFNDVLHHLPVSDQERAIEIARSRLDGAGILVLKEVEASDYLDRAHTTFWDRRIYPQDTLSFRTATDWISLAGRHGLRLTEQFLVRHPWIASRTVLVFTQRPRLAVPIARVKPPPPARPGSVRALVTGGTGFVGEWLIREILAKGIAGAATHVGIVTRRPWSVPADIARHGQVTLLPVDLSQPFDEGALGGRWDYVFHLAADVNFFGGRKTYRNNLDSTANLLAALRAAPPRRLVYASTMGAVDRGRFDRCTQPLTADSPAHPTSPYGRAKLEEEKLVRESGIPSAIVRIPWCYGPGMSRTHHVRTLLGLVRRRAPVTRIAWPGKVSILPAPVAARQFVSAATAGEAENRTFFLSDGSPISFGDLFAEMGRVAGVPQAGAIRLPRACIGPARLFSFLLPFQLKALLTDALVVRDESAGRLGAATPAREFGFLDPLAGFDASEGWPNRWRSVAVVTGAAGGIGRALARQLHGQGYSLSLVDRSTGPLDEIANLLGGTARPLDLASLEQNTAAGQLAGSDAGRVVLVISNAGLGFRGRFTELEPEKVSAMLNVNVRAVVAATIAFARTMADAGGGTIVNIASSAACQPLPYMAVYAATKSLVLSFTLAAAAERPCNGVRIVAVSPSGTRTGFQAAGSVRTNPGERLLDPETTAAEILDAAARGETLHIVGSRGRGMALFARLAPTRTLVRTWERLMRHGR